MPPSSASGPEGATDRRARGLGLALASQWAHEERKSWHRYGLGPNPLMTSQEPTPRTSRSRPSTSPIQRRSAHSTIAGRQIFDLLFVNAGVTNQPEGTVAQTSIEEFTRVMVTNALSPLRVIETLQDLVEPTGTIG